MYALSTASSGCTAIQDCVSQLLLLIAVKTQHVPGTGWVSAWVYLIKYMVHFALHNMKLHSVLSTKRKVLTQQVSL